MVSKISEGVEVSVETFYQQDYSQPLLNEFMFAYRVTIENHNHFPIKVMSRVWLVEDSMMPLRSVQGEGVVGVQPTINPGDNYQYVSGCNIKSEIGAMEGTYIVKNMRNDCLFDVQIPRFKLIAPHKLN